MSVPSQRSQFMKHAVVLTNRGTPKRLIGFRFYADRYLPGAAPTDDYQIAIPRFTVEIIEFDSAFRNCFFESDFRAEVLPKN
jgi:hypothetical protein